MTDMDVKQWAMIFLIMSFTSDKGTFARLVFAGVSAGFWIAALGLALGIIPSGIFL